MLQLAAPLGLLALGAVLAPILIHLVRRPLRVVRLGSLRFLQSERRQLRSLRWREWLLLALRCALLAALGLSLAGARWQPRAPAPARWLLVAPGATLEGVNRAEWDRLRAEGFEPRVLLPGFPLSTGAGELAPADLDPWSLLREADLRLPAGSRVIVFGPSWAALFPGTRPALGNVDVSWRVTAGEPLPRSPAPTVSVGLVAAPDRTEDARFLRSVFAAMGATVVLDDAPEWFFQLGDVSLPLAWAERVQGGARLVTDAPNAAPLTDVNRWFDVGASRVRLRQRVAVEAGAPVWRDSAGESLLTEERQGAGTRWRFAVRFLPDWSDWPLESAFPAWWREQLIPARSVASTIAPEQAAPRFAPENARAAPELGGFGRFDLRGWCWLLAAALFMLERTLSHSAARRRTSA